MFDLFSASYKKVNLPREERERFGILQEHNQKLVIINEEESPDFRRGFLVYSIRDPEVYFLRFFNEGGSIGERMFHTNDIETMLVEIELSKRNILFREDDETIIKLVQKMRNDYRRLFIEKDRENSQKDLKFKNE